jgi:Fur family transcriptional regulator, ferric uptake regulator
MAPVRGSSVCPVMPDRSTSVLMSDVRARLHDRGERMTRPRRAVLGVLVEDPEHLSAEEIVAAVAERDSSVHRATVYRTLEALGSLGVVQHVHLSHRATTYHLVTDDQDHLHLQCLDCGSITDAPSSLLGGVAAELDEKYAFALDLGHVALSGRCADCREAGRP